MNAILSRLIDKCIRHGIIKDQETDVYRYGFARFFTNQYHSFGFCGIGSQ